MEQRFSSKLKGDISVNCHLIHDLLEITAGFPVNIELAKRSKCLTSKRFIEGVALAIH
ncbi:MULTISPECIES: hypothetical protein [Paenibacillus]|uniref:Transposase n=1 Tax=Paenibacillus violae TaxID=3077234 RepID=A0ABU3R8P1_9BACL|nr:MULTISPECIES: hypothetical protein [Paenibacillus]MDU0200644.1 hypothetical protein [Paenibacillus sp. PFR10]MEC0265490.1 hypothetical protein [Paenibacillus anseongense]